MLTLILLIPPCSELRIKATGFQFVQNYFDDKSAVHGPITFKIRIHSMNFIHYFAYSIRWTCFWWTTRFLVNLGNAVETDQRYFLSFNCPSGSSYSLSSTIRSSWAGTDDWPHDKSLK